MALLTGDGGSRLGICSRVLALVHCSLTHLDRTLSLGMSRYD